MNNTLYTCEKHDLIVIVYMQRKDRISCPLCTAEERIKELEALKDELQYALDDTVTQRELDKDERNKE